MSDRHSLAAFQVEAVEAMASTIRRVAADVSLRPAEARAIALQSGTLLLQAPTGSGKTLMLGRALEAVTGGLPQPMVWLWFAPFSGLVAQTRDSLAAQCPGLRLRDLAVDREAVTTRDGDVFVQTWASVATKVKEARRIRSETESVKSLDTMLESLREEGFRIGVVIDEAHIAFRSTTEATQFYLNVLQPDVTLLATATPNDDRLREFARSAGLSVEWRVEIARRDVVAAGLNKRGLMLGIVRFPPEIEKFLDLETAALTAGWTQHTRIADRLKERDIALTPLMLVQVEDQEHGGPDPVDRVKTKLIEIGVPESAIAIHTSGQPDANFHTLAYDPSRQVLVFKMAVATGFDAPRAWTLVSVRPNRGRDFGMQVVGRIMRVHAAVRPVHGEDALLDRGYVFLSDAEVQQGLEAAAREVDAVERSIRGIADVLDVVDYAVSPPAQPGVAGLGPRLPQVPTTPEDRQLRLNRLIEAGVVPEAVRAMAPETQDRTIVAGEWRRVVTETPLFGEALPKDAFAGVAPSRLTTVGPSYRAYPLRRELGVPDRLFAERPPAPEAYDSDEFLRSVARGFIDRGELVRLVARRRQSADLSLRDLFSSDSENLQLQVRLSNRRIAEEAQGAFEFNDSIDPRLLKRALLLELRSSALKDGIEFDEGDLRRAIDLGALGKPDALVTAVKETMARFRKVEPAEAIPDPLKERDGLPEGRLAAHGVFTSDMNGPESTFAEFVDQDESGTILWWLRTPHNTSWAGKIILPNGRSFFPDFAIGVRGRSTPQQVALVEIKDDGSTGRLNADENNLKAQVQHMEYRAPFWAAKGPEGQFERLQWNSALRRIVATNQFRVQTMVLVG